MLLRLMAALLWAAASGTGTSQRSIQPGTGTAAPQQKAGSGATQRSIQPGVGTSDRRGNSP